MRLAFLAPAPALLRGSWQRGLLRGNAPRSLRRSRATFRASTAVEPLRPMSAAAARPTQSGSDAKPLGAPTFQDAVRLLQDYWASQGCVLWQPCNTEVGAGTMNPATFLRVLGPEPWAVAYEEPSLRPDDSRFGANPNRLQRHTQFQVIVKPAPACAQELVLGSYRALGIDLCKHDVRFVEDNWASPALGAWGLGWEVWLDGMEVTQFTYFQQAGGLPLDAVSVEVTYGLERIVMALQGRTHFKDIVFAPGVSYGEIFLQSEYEMSVYNLNDADVARNARLFDEYEAEAKQLLEKKLPFAAYSFLLKASHTFNVLDARGAVGVTERARFFQRMRALARDVATLWVDVRRELEFPLLPPVPPSPPASETSAPPTKKQSAALPPTERLLLEIGVEELPPAALDSMIAQVERLFAGMLRDHALAFDSVKVSGTPRRVAIAVHGLQTRQEDVEETVRGPPLRVARGEDGAPTRAALGFLKKQGISSDDGGAVRYDEDTGYMYATVQRTGQSAVDVLAEAIPAAVLGKISFGKTMRWNDSGVAFSRPIRWLLCLLGDKQVSFEYAGVSAGNITRSLRGADGFASPVMVPSAGEYNAELEKAQIMLCKEQRKDLIVAECESLVAAVGGRFFLDEGLLEEVANLVENPIPILGSFDSSFLALPDEVLITVMKKHQRYFPVRDASTDALVNSFITVVNGDSNRVDLDAIRAGNEAVLRARYADASFFYENDTKATKLADFVPALDRIAFQESLGSMLDKTKRIQEIVPALGKCMGLSAPQQATASEAAKLAKADLATSMVIEMTSLAGVMGQHYSEKSGEVGREVSAAIFEAALPRFSGDQLPASSAGAAVGIADRLDSMLTLFSVGLAPRATADPFALRRAALGVVQTLAARGVDADLRALADAADVSRARSAENRRAVVAFLEKRLEGFLADAPGLRPDVVKAALAPAANTRNPARAHAAARALQSTLDTALDKVRAAAEAHARAARLLKSLGGAGAAELAKHVVDAGLFEAPAERALQDALAHAAREAEAPGAGAAERVQALANIKPQVDAFFDEVLVNAPDERVRRNRLALAARVVEITAACADLALLQL